jgi:hypothetical protein
MRPQLTETQVTNVVNLVDTDGYYAALRYVMVELGISGEDATSMVDDALEGKAVTTDTEDENPERWDGLS